MLTSMGIEYERYPGKSGFKEKYTLKDKADGAAT